MKPDFYPCEMLTISEAAAALRIPVDIVEQWIIEGRFPPPVEIEITPIIIRKVIPKEEAAYIAAMMTAGKGWSSIELAVARLVKLREKRMEQCRPGHLDYRDYNVIELT